MNTDLKRHLPVVQKLTRRSELAFKETPREGLRTKERAISPNAVTGHSVNVPIATTCQPSKVCARSCYAASNLLAATKALPRQARVQTEMDAAPVAFAQRVCAEYDKFGLTFLRWNGVGDLTLSAVEAINWIASNRPDVTLWVVTRIPEMARLIEPAPRVFVHFSLDASSLDRKARFEGLKPRRNYFFSYQCEKGKGVDREAGASVVFAHRYKVPEGAGLGGDASCPLNGASDCEGMCAKCRRCFNGEAVRMRLESESRGETT